MKNEQQQHPHPHGEYLSAYADHRLDVARMHDIGLHLGQCAACTQEVKRFEALRAHLRGVPVPPPPSQFWTSAYRRLRAEQHARTARPRRGSFVPAGRWAAGVAAAAVAVGLVFSPLTHTPTTPPQNAATVASAPVSLDVSPDVAVLVASHTDSVSRLPLADVDRQKMIAADARQGPDLPDVADTADGSF